MKKESIKKIKKLKTSKKMSDKDLMMLGGPIPKGKKGKKKVGWS
jgi:hypothetical protein